MKRAQWAVAIAAVFLWGCGGKAALPDVFAETLGGWHKTGERDVTEPPDPAVGKAERIRVATYEGPGKLEARVYTMPSSAVALDVVQRWNPRADTVFFYRDRFFVVVKWDKAEKAGLEAFMRALEAKFAGAS